jgi:hypothetical protein
MPSAPSVVPSDNTEPTIFRTPSWARWFSLIAAIILGGITAMMLAFAIFLLFKREWWLGALVAAVAIFMAGLTGYVLRDLRGKWGLRVELRADRVVLDLPGGRSLIHRPPAQQLTIPYADIDAVETRLDAIVARAHVPLRDLGMVEGRGGVLAVWGTYAPDWAAPSLPLAQQLRLWRHAAATGTFAIAVIIVALAIRLLAGP